MALFFAVELDIIGNVSKILWWGCFTAVFACLTSFIGTFFQKTRKISWIVFGVSLLSYIALSFNPEIKERKDIDACVDSGNVWNDNEHRCRTDCWRWSKEKGCEKE